MFARSCTFTRRLRAACTKRFARSARASAHTHMPLILCGLDLLLITGIGVAAFSMFDTARRPHWAELIGFSFAGGMGVVGLLMFWLSLMGVAPTRGESGAIAAVAA